MYKIPPNTNIYLNTPYFGLVHAETIKARLVAQENLLLDGATYGPSQGLKTSIQCKQLIAKSIHTDVQNIALVSNFTIAHEMLLHSLPKGKVAVLENDYPSIGLPYKLKSWELVSFRFDPNMDFMSQINDYLRAEKPTYLVISHVDYTSGVLLPLSELNEICLKHSVRLILDVTQSYGLIDIDTSFTSISVIMTSSYKWIGAGHGGGFIYISPEFQSNLEVKIGGANSQFVYENSSNSKLKSFEPGHLDFSIFFGFKSALEIYFEEDYNRWEKVRPLVDLVYEKLSRLIIWGNREKKYRSALISLRLNKEQIKLLSDAKIQFTFRNGLSRIGIHHYNTKSEIETLIKILA